MLNSPGVCHSRPDPGRRSWPAQRSLAPEAATTSGKISAVPADYAIGMIYQAAVSLQDAHMYGQRYRERSSPPGRDELPTRSRHHLRVGRMPEYQA